MILIEKDSNRKKYIVVYLKGEKENKTIEIDHRVLFHVFFKINFIS